MSDPNWVELWNEFKHLREKIDDLSDGQEKILNELGGNGGPGIRTRLYNLGRRMRVVEITQLIISVALLFLLVVLVYHMARG